MDQNKTTQISLSIDVSMRLVDYNDKVYFLLYLVIVNFGKLQFKFTHNLSPIG